MKWVAWLYIFSLLGPIPQPERREDTLLFSGHFEKARFGDFADSIRKQTGVTMFYLDSWVQDIHITLSGSGHSLLPTLDSILQPVGLNYFLDEWGHLFITDTTRLLSVLPEYVTPAAPEKSVSMDMENRTLYTGAPRLGNGSEILVPETIHVGSTASASPGRRVLINGRITDRESGEPLIGATVYIGKIKKGTSTNAEGYFHLILNPGTYEVTCNNVGMEPLLFTMIVHSDGDLSLTMKRTLIPLDEVVVRANRYHNVRGNQMGFEQLKYNVFKEIPLVMGERDIINVVKMLPGVQSIGEGASGFNVRGSGVDQNMIYVNNVPVYNPSHLFGFFTSFSPEIVADFTLYKSNLPASYGGRLASFFDIRTRQGNMKRFSARGGISVVSAYGAMEIPVQKDKSSLIMSARSTYSDWLLRRMQDPLLRHSKAGFNDISGAYTHILNDKTRIRVFGYRSSDRFTLGKINTFSYGNTGGSVDVRHRFSQQTTGNIALVYSRYHFSTSDVQIPSAGYQHSYQLDHIELKTDFSWLSLGNHKLTYGASVIHYHLNRGIIEPYGLNSLRKPLDLGMENGIESAGYIGDEITLNDRFTAYAGLRLSSFMSLGPSMVRKYSPGMPMVEENIADTLFFGRGKISKFYYGVEPRLNLRYLLGENSSVKLSYNRGTQYLFMLSNTVALAPSDQWKLCDYHIGPQSLDQVSAGYYKDFTGTGLNTSLEIYRKWGHHIIEYRDGASFIESPWVESETLQGIQRSYGIEAMIRKSSGSLNGWLTYTYARTLLQVDDPVTGEQINGGKPFPSLYDRPHSVTLVANYRRGRRVSYSANLVYMTGRPVTYPVSVYYEYGIPYIHYSDRNKYRIPDYFRVDVSLNIEGNLRRRKLFHSFWMINVYNLTGRKNAYSVYFKNVNGYIHGYKLSIFAQPIVTVSWNVKLGNYASE